MIFFFEKHERWAYSSFGSQLKAKIKHNKVEDILRIFQGMNPFKVPKQKGHNLYAGKEGWCPFIRN